jgi:hypothetical protein
MMIRYSTLIENYRFNPRTCEDAPRTTEDEFGRSDISIHVLAKMRRLDKPAPKNSGLFQSTHREGAGYYIRRSTWL